MSDSEEVRPGWIAKCVNGHSFRATLLKPWGARWIVFYPKGARAVFIDDYAEGHQDIADYLTKERLNAFFPGEALELSDFVFGEPARCPSCDAPLPFESSVGPNAALWVEGYTLLDGKLGRKSHLKQVELRP